MEPPCNLTHTVNVDAMQREYLHEQQDKKQQQLTDKSHDRTNDQNHSHDHPLDETERMQAKVERWKTAGHPRHPIWQFFEHTHTHHDTHTSSPHLKTTTRDQMDVVCALCGAHLHAEHELKKGEDEPQQQQLTLARSMVHGMWQHLAKECVACPDDVRRDMASWHQLPEETRGAPLAVVVDSPSLTTE